MSHSAAVSVINNHKASIEEIHKSKSFSDGKYYYSNTFKHTFIIFSFNF